MGLTASQQRNLSRKAQDNSLEVEHLLKVAIIGDASDAPLLRALKGDHAWSDTGREDGALIVPLGRWAETICRFWEDGYPGLVAAANESDQAIPFCIGLLKELKTAESVSAILDIGRRVIDRPGADIALAVRLADAFNLLLSFKDAPPISAMTEGRIRNFLHCLLRSELSLPQRASAVCALRGVGDAESVLLIKSLAPFEGRWAGLEAEAVRQIRKREHRIKRDGG